MKPQLAEKLPCRDGTRTKQNERKVVNNKFDDLAKGMAQSVTRRGALKRFGLGMAGIALACLGLANKAEADPTVPHCKCRKAYYGCNPLNSVCMQYCFAICSPF
jgi:hypothetical protein